MTVSPALICLQKMLLNFTSAVAQCRAGQTKAVAFTSTAALHLASTLGQLLATLCNGWALCPKYLPQISILVPAPVGRILCFWLS